MGAGLVLFYLAGLVVLSEEHSGERRFGNGICNIHLLPTDSQLQLCNALTLADP